MRRESRSALFRSYFFSHLVTLRVLEMSPAATLVVGKDAQLRAHKVHSSTCTPQAEFKVVLDVCRHSWRGRSRLPPMRRRYCQDVLACLPLSVAPVSHVESVQLFFLLTGAVCAEKDYQNPS